MEQNNILFNVRSDNGLVNSQLCEIKFIKIIVWSNAPPANLHGNATLW